MALGSAAFIIRGVLFLSSQTPSEFGVVNDALWISDPEVLEASVLGSKVQLMPKKSEGLAFVTGLKIESQSLKEPLKVVITNPQNLEALRRCPDVAKNLNLVGQLEFDGSYLEWVEIQKTCRFSALALKSETSLSQSTEWQNAERRMQSAGLRVLRSAWVEGKREILLDGNDDSTSTRAIEKLQPLLPFYKIKYTRAGARPGQTLIFQLTFFEISRSKAQALGIRWPAQLTWKVSADPRTLGAAKNSNLPEFGADFGESLGIGRILAQPMLRTLPGERASFQSGGEIPVEFKSEKEKSTTWKNYGLILEITPSKDLVSGQSEISIDFKVELSEPDFGVSRSENPGMRKRSLSSRFDLRVGEVTVLSSLLQSRLSGGRQGLPGFSDLPFLNRLFSSKENLANDSELWFGIRPTWEEPLFPQNLETYDAAIRKL
jgi:hypothetical protein